MKPRLSHVEPAPLFLDIETKTRGYSPEAMPCKCGATDHSRTSSKKCSLHAARPGAPELFKPPGVRSSLDCTVYKTTLSQLLGEKLNEHKKRLRDQIESTVRTLTLASFHASIDLERRSRAFNPLKRPLEDNEDDQPQDVDQPQDAPPEFTNKFIRNLFSKHGPKGVALSYAVEDYMTNLENHFRLQLGRCYRKVADIVATRIIKKGKKAKNTLKWAFINDPELFQSVFPLARDIHLLIDDPNPDFQQCLSSIKTMNKMICKVTGYWFSSLVPIHSLKAKYITIDTNGFYELLGGKRGTGVRCTDFGVDRDQWFQQVFPGLPEYLLDPDGPVSKQRFHYFLKTDGVGVSVHKFRWDQRQRNVSSPPIRWKTSALIPAPENVKMYVGIDPGRRSIITTVKARPEAWESSRFDETSVQISNKQHQVRSATKWTSRWTQTRLQHLGLKEYLHDTPLFRTPGVAGIDKYYQYILLRINDIINFNVSRATRRVRFQAHRARQKAIWYMCEKILEVPWDTAGTATGPPERDKAIVIGFGDGNKNGNFGSGNAPAPNGRRIIKMLASCGFKERFVAAEVSEFNTSQVCSKWLSDQRLESTEHWGVKRCEICDRWWNRDINAARNMLCLVYEAIGLFAMKRNAPNGTVLFRKNDVILEYVGEIIPVSETSARYGDQTAVYTLRRNQTTDIDAACKRGVAAMANSKPGANNARFGAAGRGENYRMVLRATKNILHGQEIFAHYGGNYRFNEPGVQYSTRYRSKFRDRFQVHDDASIIEKKWFLLKNMVKLETLVLEPVLMRQSKPKRTKTTRHLTLGIGSGPVSDPVSGRPHPTPPQIDDLTKRMASLDLNGTGTGTGPALGTSPETTGIGTETGTGTGIGTGTGTETGTGTGTGIASPSSSSSPSPSSSSSPSPKRFTPDPGTGTGTDIGTGTGFTPDPLRRTGNPSEVEYTGLRNFDNNCYLNAGVQLLRNMPEIFPDNALDTGDEDIRALINVINPKVKRRLTVDTVNACERLIFPPGPGGSGAVVRRARQQQDPHEMIHWILDEHLKSDLYRFDLKTTYRYYVPDAAGRLNGRYVSFHDFEDPDYSNSHTESYNMITPHIEINTDTITLQSLINRYVEQFTVSGDYNFVNRYYEDERGRRIPIPNGVHPLFHAISIIIPDANRYLIIHCVNIWNVQRDSITKRVDLDLVVPEYVKISGVRYMVISVILHAGG
ncbi:hypothetical protein HK102_000533 [Quaeritorhiza haematococci]|nr:hypothetical protein HK102_000533 [Quaeritorhiza haematococci]